MRVHQANALVGLLILIPGLALSQQNEKARQVIPPKTAFLGDGPLMYNGSGWKSWSDDFKAAYLVGMNEGGFYLGTVNCTCYTALLPKSKSVGEIKISLDRFFSDPTNLRIHVVEALTYLELEARGGTAAELAQRMQQLRHMNQR